MSVEYASSPKRISRRTRGERTKRRQRYNERNSIVLESEIFHDVSVSSGESAIYSTDNNHWNKCQQVAMGNKVSSNTNQTTSKPRDHLYKILVIGDLGTGKTSIIKRYVHRFFTQNYRATIGVDFALKVLNWDENTLIRLQLWDIAGQERYGNMTRVYYKEAVGAFIVFDVTRRNTFDSVANWKSDLDSKVQLPDGSPIPCILLANKCDQLKESLVNSRNMDQYCQENGFATWFETSARDNINIDEATKTLVEKILEKDSLLNSEAKKGSGQFSLTLDTNEQNNGKTSCSC